MHAERERRKFANFTKNKFPSKEMSENRGRKRDFET